jgi:hypothetical protein
MTRPVDEALEKARAAGIEDAFRLLLSVFDAGAELFSKTEIPASLPAERFRRAMADVEIELIGYPSEEAFEHWGLATEPESGGEG